jgi:hypothetical protein
MLSASYYSVGPNDVPRHRRLDVLSGICDNAGPNGLPSGVIMSIFAVNYLCREVLRDHAFRAAMKADPAKALAGLDLTDDERRALVAGDVGTLYRMGVNGFLMGYLARFEVCGLNVEIYNERMRAVKVDEIGQPVG